jgi:hypothetical protein
MHSPGGFRPALKYEGDSFVTTDKTCTDGGSGCHLKTKVADTAPSKKKEKEEASPVISISNPPPPLFSFQERATRRVLDHS